MFSAVFSCRGGMEAQHAAPLLAFLKLNDELYSHVIREICAN